MGLRIYVNLIKPRCTNGSEYGGQNVKKLISSRVFSNLSQTAIKLEFDRRSTDINMKKTLNQKWLFFGPVI